MGKIDTTVNQGTGSGSMSWALADQIGSQLVNVGLSVWQSAYIAPELFGQFAIIATISSLSYLVIGFGFGKALIARKTVSDEELGTAVSANIAICAILSTLILLLSAKIAEVLNCPEIGQYLVWTPIGLMASAAGQVGYSMLVREMRFREIFVAYMVARLTTGIPAILLAMQGWGIWSLIIQQVSCSIVQMILVNRFACHVPRLRFSRKILKRLTSESVGIFGVEVLNFSIENVDKLIIAKFLNSTAVGLYSRAYQITMLPVQNFPRVLDRFMLPLLSRSDLSQSAQIDTLLRAIRLVAIVVSPILGALSVAASDIVRSVFKPSWYSMASLIPIIAVSAMFASFSEITASFYIAQGRSHLLFGLNLIARAALIAAIVYASHHNILWVVCAVSLGSALRMMLLSLPLIVILRCRVILALRSATPSLVAIACSIMLFPIGQHWLQGVHSALRVLLLSLAYIGIYFIIIRRTDARALNEFKRLINSRGSFIEAEAGKNLNLT